MNRIILIGNLGQDPECKIFASGSSVAQFSLATTKRYKDKQGELKTDTSWHNIVLWGKLAEIAEKYLKKGAKVMIEGEIKYETYQSDGVTKHMTKIIGNNLEMLSAKEGGQKSQAQTTQTTQDQPTQPDEPDNDFEETDDLPF